MRLTRQRRWSRAASRARLWRPTARPLPGWTVLAEPRPGLSLARNRALAWVEDDDEVLAFVDDDAVVDPGWGAALAARWDDAPERVACIGGPIRPRFDSPPPAWVSDPILPALTVLDRGAAVLDLDPAREEAVYGANISFRAGPLRRVGGFDPAWGHSGGRTWFGEENEAQVALARLGYTTRYVPDAGVDHVIPAERLTRGSFVRRRYAFGEGARREGRAGPGAGRTPGGRGGGGSPVGRRSARRPEGDGARRARRREPRRSYGSTRPRLIA